MDFDEFFEQQHDPLLRMCWGMCADRELARDIAQETMCRAYVRWAELSMTGSTPAAWCRTVALNLVRSDWRRRSVASAAGPSLASRAAVVHLDAPSIDPDLDAALASLSTRQREAVVLHHLLDLSIADVAASMEVSESSVKAHLQRGRAQLATLLGAAELETT